MAASSLQPVVVSKTSLNSNGIEKSNKQQDNGAFNQKNGKNWGRRRETPAYPRSDRRPNTAIAKKFVPERRGRQRDAAIDCWDDYLSVDVSHEQASVGKRFSSKKHNLNHLLNFSFTPRETHESAHNQKCVKYAKFSKERFLQANCQFIVKYGNDYSKYKVDPDLLIDWDLVEEVRFNSLTSESIVCPICLHTPVAAKITKCGHIYCWSCIFHYLALSDQTFRKCPICFDAICKRDLRSVLSVSRKDYKIGDEIVLSLMKRRRGSIICGPTFEELESDFSSFGKESSASLYHKLLIAEPAQVFRVIVSREKTQLQKQLSEEGETPEACFIESALQSLNEREEAMREAASPQHEELVVDQSSTAVELNSAQSPQKFESIASTTKVKASDRDDFYYFYQSNDGQHIYLNSLNVRMLCHEYGALDKCPPEIKAKIIEMEWATMNDERRKRHRYMQHLPLTCEFRIVELDFSPPILSENTLQLFRGEINRRERERRKRAREENRRDRNIKAEQQKKIHGIYPLPRFQLNSMHHFPVCSNEIAIPPSPSPAFSDASSEDVEVVEHNIPEDCLGSSPSFQPEFPSFASMLKDGKAKAENIASKKVKEAKDAVKEEDEYAAKPLHQYSLSDAFEAALTMKDSKKKRKGKK
ncbi:RING finger protein 10-like isoform X2 [Dinothrombium tinctorium]|uniref:E3 ubiquitin-protein ligase RNF10 n=1 Tax=Dinothrombium tinctorium TaxID=1965070 RepID=A0A3S3S041_9ACAR|nr:RING finger protein 10-like isoform X2 [Dinothrombium tinctorium]